MKFGVNTFIWSENFGHATLPLLTTLRDHGFDGVELPLLDPKAALDLEVRRAVEQNKLQCTFCSVFVPGRSFIDDDASVRHKTVEHMRACIRTAAEMGGEMVAGPLYSPVGWLPGRRRTDEEWKREVDCLQQLTPDLDDAGVRLAIEPLNRFETHFLNTIADSVALCRSVGHARVGILLDTFHTNIEEKHLGGACREAGGLLFHVHASENDRGIPGTGHVEWDQLFTALHGMKYQGWVNIESFSFAGGELPRLVCIWRDLAHSPEAVAFEGVRFLRSAAKLST
jgi:D-psicose/D-tagatose/L-ribulose 3-epimerase